MLPNPTSPFHPLNGHYFDADSPGMIDKPGCICGRLISFNPQ
jgi:hypothetical protein